jgi:phage repressor protein C with HTH and peptisase S24 domain
MFSNEQVWNAIDKLASRNGLSASRLSIIAGLDPTALNKSKRIGPDGRPRWMSTETLAKILNATSTSAREFFDLTCSSEGSSADRASSEVSEPTSRSHVSRP